MRKIVDDKANFTLWEDLGILTFPDLERIYRSLCYGNSEPDEMQMSPDMFEFLDKVLFNLNSEFKIYMKFHHASVIIKDLPPNQIIFNTTKVPDRFINELYRVNGIVNV